VSHTKLGFIRVWLTFVLPAVEVYQMSKRGKDSEKGNHGQHSLCDQEGNPSAKTA
jgi:hypothetical protein